MVSHDLSVMASHIIAFLFYKQIQSRKSQVHVQNPNTSKHIEWITTVTMLEGGQ